MTAAAFRAMHHGRAADDPLVLPGPWDASSARVFADLGFPALATPSAGVAASLGYVDHETPLEEMFAAIKRIARAVSVPVSADVEDGYGLRARELVGRLLDAGAVGCNLEDSQHGTLKDPEQHAEWLAEVRAEAGQDLVINARVDTFIQGGEAPDAVDRARRYVEAGADCIYPIVAPREAFRLLRAGVDGPLNALAEPDAEHVSELAGLGATRITFGPLMQHRAAAAVRAVGERLLPG